MTAGDLEESAPAAMFEQEFVHHFTTLIASDAEATFQAFEMLLGRPIGEDEIEPRNAAYRQAGRALSVVAYLQSRTWLSMWARRMADWWTGHDLLLTPTLGARPSSAGSPRPGQSRKGHGSSASSPTPRSST